MTRVKDAGTLKKGAVSRSLRTFANAGAGVAGVVGLAGRYRVPLEVRIALSIPITLKGVNSDRDEAPDHPHLVGPL